MRALSSLQCLGIEAMSTVRILHGFLPERVQNRDLARKVRRYFECEINGLERTARERR